MISLIKKALKRIITPFITKDIGNINTLPTILNYSFPNKNHTITHVSAFNYGNAGDVLLPIALQDTWKKILPSIQWENQPVYPIVNDKLVEKINTSKGLVIGGGGLFLKDTNTNQISGWQWPCSIEMLHKIKVPIFLFAVGYNRFRNQDEFEPFFYENLTAFAEKAVYLGIRNQGSINALKGYLPQQLHHKLRFQPCMTTFTAELYPELTDYKSKEDFIAVNAAFDRSHLRFGDKIGNILTDTAKAIKEASKHYPIKFYSHMPSDDALLPFMQSFGIKYELVRLNNAHPSDIIKEYAKPKLVVGMRGHAQMIPFGCKTPIVSIVSHNKMQWFLDDIGQPEWGADVLSPSYGHDLTGRIMSSLDNTKHQIEFISEKQKELFNISINNVKDGLTAMHLV